MADLFPRGQEKTCPPAKRHFELMAWAGRVDYRRRHLVSNPHR